MSAVSLHPGSVEFIDIEMSDMTAYCTRQAEADALPSAGESEAAGTHYLEIE